MSRPSPSMKAALVRALSLEKGYQGQPWVAGRYRRTAVACARRGWALPYQVTPDGQIFYLISPAGRALIVEDAP